jgi:DNA-binding beta-propeller fold protein YncE
MAILLCSPTARLSSAGLKGKIARRVSVKFRPEAILVLPDNTGFIESDLPYEMIHWDFKTMKEMNTASSRQVPTAALVHDPRGKVYRVSYQGIEIYDATKGEFEDDMRPFRSSAVGAGIDTQTGNLIVLGVRSVYFIDPMSRQLLAETPIAAGSRIVSGSVEVADRTLYVVMQPAADNHAFAVPVNLDRFTAGDPLDLGVTGQFTPLVCAPRPGQEEFYLSGSTGGKEPNRLFFKAVSSEQGEFARFFMLGGSQPPVLIFSPDGRYLVAFSKNALSVEGRKPTKGATSGNLMILDIESGLEVQTLLNEISQPRGAAFSADGTKLYVLDGEGSIVVIE